MQKQASRSPHELGHQTTYEPSHAQDGGNDDLKLEERQYHMSKTMDAATSNAFVPN